MALDRTRSVRLKRQTVRYLIGALALILLLVFAFSRNRGVIAESIHVPSSRAVTYAERVKNAMRHNFRGYAKHCFGDDEYEPVSGRCHHWFGMGLTILDSIDTLLIMGLREEYELARKWVETLDIKSNTKSVSMFESVIRVLGGLNSAYAMTGDDIWKKKAIEFGDAVIHAFDTPSGCPNPEVTLHGRDAGGNSLASTAEVGTLQLEFRTLSVMSGNPKYAEAADKCELALLSALPTNSLPTANFLTGTAKFAGDVLTIGANTDSFIEMMLKTWIAFGKKEDKLKVAFEKSVEHVFSQLGIQENGTLVLGISQATGPNIPPAEPQKVMEHLACFFPGALALAAMHGLGGGVHGTKEQDYMTRARKLTRTCFLMTRTTPEGLAPEISEFVNGTLRVKEDARHSLLRPEIVESHYLLNEVTGGVEEQYREWGKIMWDDFERSARTKRTYLLSSVFKLGTRDSHHGDKLHSFVLAETLKYFYLLFRGSGEEPRMALDEWVFNTEAHPVRIQSSPKVLGTSKYKFR